MSTRGTVWYDEGEPMDWVPDARPWCPLCCVPSCGCPIGERLDDEAHLIRGSE